MKPGLEAEKITMKLLKENGTDARWSTPEEDMFLKVDLWFPIDGGWIGVQLSTDMEDISGEKGHIVLNRGIVPMWVDWDRLQVAVEEDDGADLTKEFCRRVREVFNNFPNLKIFSEPEWDLRLQMK